MPFDELLRLLSSCDIDDETSEAQLRTTLDGHAKTLATDPEARVALGNEPSLWDSLEKLWKAVSANATSSTSGERHWDLVGTLASVSEPQIRSLVHYSTSFLMQQDPVVASATRFLLQALSNIVTENSPVAALLWWTTYMGIPDDSNILLRTLEVQDVKTLMTCFVLMLNATKGRPEACEEFVSTKAGQRIAIKLLNKISVLIDAPEGTAENTACDIAYQFLKHTFDGGLAITLYDSFHLEGEHIIPHQITLLKLLDGYLQSPNVSIHATYSKSIPTLYTRLISDISASLQQSLAANSGSVAPEGDLPALGEGVVLTAQCCQALLLSEADQSPDQRATLKAMLEIEVDTIRLTAETLRSLDLLLPRIQMGKPVPSPMAPPSSGDDGTGSDPTAFPYLKRDLLRLLGTMAYRNTIVQDRMRDCGGLEVVMNHCVVDERNPFLREHAIFALRNLLEGNEANQEYVRELKPMRDFDTDGILRNVKPDT